MGCCGKIKKLKNIVHGLSSYTIEKTTGIPLAKCLHTDDRIRICQTCPDNDWRNNGKSLWCGICDCFIPGKARVEVEKCPGTVDKWKEADLI